MEAARWAWRHQHIQQTQHHEEDKIIRLVALHGTEGEREGMGQLLENGEKNNKINLDGLLLQP